MTEPVTVKFYFDIVSPFSYFAFERLYRYEKAWNLSIELYPVHLARILMSSGNFPPWNGDAKVKYVKVDIHRNIQELQLNWNLDMSRLPTPSFSDMSTLSALKGLLSLEQFKEVIGRLFAEQVANTSPPSDLFACLVPSHVSQDTLDKAKELPQTQGFVSYFEKEHQMLLNDHGAFGLPWILLQQPGGDRYESFWGSDRMGSMAHWLGPNYVYTGTSPKTT
ncbi:Glutathione S-transferase kappa 1 [Ceratobasidium sp. 394]|nr:Glutathione S-transferase kappa 1 [Ceratobasidium sp. 394]KAG9074665.1 Glutathione S-transferase kappa 1 [Ceratobasidium sp. UAMH 11750]